MLPDFGRWLHVMNSDCGETGVLARRLWTSARAQLWGGRAGTPRRSISTIWLVRD